MPNPKNSARYTFRKSWSWPFEVEQKIKDLVELCEDLNHLHVLHVCCGESKLGNVRVDVDARRKPTIVANMFQLVDHPELKQLMGTFDTVVCDPPWELAYHLRGRLLRQLRDMLKPGGRLIFNCFWFPKTRGLAVDPQIYVGVPHSIVEKCFSPDHCSTSKHRPRTRGKHYRCALAQQEKVGA